MTSHYSRVFLKPKDSQNTLYGDISTSASPGTSPEEASKLSSTSVEPFSSIQSMSGRGTGTMTGTMTGTGTGSRSRGGTGTGTGGGMESGTDPGTYRSYLSGFSGMYESENGEEVGGVEDTRVRQQQQQQPQLQRTHAPPPRRHPFAMAQSRRRSSDEPERDFNPGYANGAGSAAPPLPAHVHLGYHQYTGAYNQPQPPLPHAQTREQTEKTQGLPPLHAHRPIAQQTHPQSRIAERTRIHPLFIVLLFLPLPPLLAAAYMPTGQAILRGSHSSSSANTTNSPSHIPSSSSSSSSPTPNPYSPSLSSSVQAGLTGGVILALPLALLLYALLFLPLSSESKNRQASTSNSNYANHNDDFFDDSSDSGSNILPFNFPFHLDLNLISSRPRSKLRRALSFTAFVLFVLLIGAISGPLGVSVLSPPSSSPSSTATTATATARNMKYLTPHNAGLAGLVGGVVIVCSALVVCVIVGGGMWMSVVLGRERRRRGRDGDVSAGGGGNGKGNGMGRKGRTGPVAF
ncbi:hypothetical protein CPB83DRAFT_200738 [Crepidotus variabilis]|uniref:Uncharacterized protein n=1 Tax=Crepidotus variabilis TaxID=179855 RepID=A0A9P6JRT6_9AGAR|nr:hypothetical protein CPB83DRAFT_200738 [Crepidotus variabilis]